MFWLKRHLCSSKDILATARTSPSRVMEFSDLPLAPLHPPLGTRRGRLSRDALVHEDGPPVLCIFIGTPQGRWHAEFARTSRAPGDATLFLCAANSVSVLADADVETPVTFGMAVIISWRFVHGAPTHEHTEAMLLAAQAAHPRRKGH